MSSPPASSCSARGGDSPRPRRLRASAPPTPVWEGRLRVSHHLLLPLLLHSFIAGVQSAALVRNSQTNINQQREHGNAFKSKLEEFSSHSVPIRSNNSSLHRLAGPRKKVIKFIIIHFLSACSKATSDLCRDKTEFIVSILPQIAIFSRASATSPPAWRDQQSTR